jgi:hypothetical protein
MPTSTRPRRSSAAPAGRFGRSASTRPAGRAGRRPAVPQRRGVAGGWLQRRQPQKQSQLKRMLGGLSGALPGRGKRQSTSSTKGGRRGKVGGLALLAGAAGLVLKNRDRVASLARRDEGHHNHDHGAGGQAPATPPSADTASTNAGASDPPQL